MKQEEIESAEVYYKRIQNLANGLQVPTTYSFIIIMFTTGLQSYLRIVTTGMKWSNYNNIKRRQCCVKKV
jgi:hypothetical protein